MPLPASRPNPLACLAWGFAFALVLAPGVGGATVAAHPVAPALAGKLDRAPADLIEAGLLMHPHLRRTNAAAAAQRKLGPDLLTIQPAPAASNPPRPAGSGMLDFLGLQEPPIWGDSAGIGPAAPFARWIIATAAVLGAFGCGTGVLLARRKARAANRVFDRLMNPEHRHASA